MGWDRMEMDKLKWKRGGAEGWGGVGWSEVGWSEIRRGKGEAMYGAWVGVHGVR